MDLTTPAIRPRTDDDLDDCVGILRAVHERSGYPVNWPSDPAGWLAGGRAWVADADGHVAGHVAVIRDGDSALVERLFVDPAHSGEGVGRALLRHGQREARGLSDDVFLDVVAAPDAANGLYRSEGWIELGRRSVDWGRDATTELVRYRAP